MSQLKKLKIRMRCFLEDGRFLWFIPESTDVLCKYSLDFDEIVLMYKLQCKGSYSVIIRYARQLVLIPYSAEEILVFDMDKEVFNGIKLPETDSVYRRDAKFFQGFIVGNIVYLIPGNYPYILKVDLDSFEVAKSENLFWQCRAFFSAIGVKWTVTASAWDGHNVLYFGIGDERQNICLGKLDMDTLCFRIRKAQCANSWIKAMICYKDNIFFYSGDWKIIKMNGNLEEIEVISESIMYDYQFPNDMDIVDTFVAAGKIMFVRNNGLDMVALDLQDECSVSKGKLIDESVRYASGTRSGYVIQPDREGYFYHINRDGGIKKLFQIKEEILEDYILKSMENDSNIILENKVWQLPEWSQSISDESFSVQDIKNCGREVYQCTAKNL